MEMDTRGGCLWVVLCVVGHKDMTGHNNKAWGGHRWSLRVGIRSCRTREIRSHNQTYQGMPMVTVLTVVNMRHSECPLNAK